MIATLQKYFDRRSLNRDMAARLSAATNFETNGLAAGGRAYKVLYQQSCDAIEKHSARWKTPTEHLVVEFPALYKLQQMADPKRAPKSSVPVVAIFLVAVALIAASAMMGLMDGVYHLMAKMVLR